jgi:superfamily II RNA helicase
MKCKSCETEINPKWKHAIDTNKCPFCGAEIMDEQLKTLFLTLSATIESLSAYPDQLNDWMLLNHSYVKTDSPTLINFLPKSIVEDLNTKLEKTTVVKVKSANGEEEEVEVKKIQSDQKTDEFFKRAEAVRPNIDGFKNTADKTQHLKSLAAQIKKAGSSSGAALISENDGEGADPEELAELGSMMQYDNPIASSLLDTNDDEIPAAVLAMANSKGGLTSNKDLLKLQQMHDRVANSRDNFESGASRGKNSFSRSG